MPDRSRISQDIDALTMTPLDDEQRRLAAVNVHQAMTRNGNSNEQILVVLDALGLPRLTQSAEE